MDQSRLNIQSNTNESPILCIEKLYLRHIQKYTTGKRGWNKLSQVDSCPWINC